jgi:hypothetical protein
MGVMEEWNEGSAFNWQPATVYIHGYYTRVVQEDGLGGLHIATYITSGEGDLVSLRVYCDVTKDVAANPAPHSEQWVKREVKKDQLCGTEYWWSPDRRNT